MKEAIANAGVFNIIIVFVIVLLSFFIGSLGYSKAYKIKNRIIDEIEKDGEYSESTQYNIENWLSEIGYRFNNDLSFSCPSQEYNGGSVETINNSSDFQYCVYKFDNCAGDRDSETGKCSKPKASVYYRVIVYMYFDVPIINNLIRLPVVGETKSFVEINGQEGYE